ncbi:MAG: hypothetical protein ACT4QF_05705 [Sporichthyaceae bacterium]
MSPSRKLRLLLPLLVLVLAAVLAWELFARSAIPVSFNGTVESITVKDEHPGTKNAWFVTIGESSRQVDPAFGRQLALGQQVHKDAWSREIRIGPKTVRLRPSSEAKAAWLFGPAAVAVSAFLALAPVSPARGRGSRTPTRGSRPRR